MTSAMTVFAVAVGSTSLLCYAAMTRLQNRRANRSPSSEGGNLAGGDGSSVGGWFAGGHSGPDCSGSPRDAGCQSDSGGGDGGGGD